MAVKDGACHGGMGSSVEACQWPNSGTGYGVYTVEYATIGTSYFTNHSLGQSGSTLNFLPFYGGLGSGRRQQALNPRCETWIQEMIVEASVCNIAGLVKVLKA